MIEVEIKIPLYKRSLAEKALCQEGFVPGNLLRETDYYYTSDFHDFMKSDEALRIRVTENLSDNSQNSCITYKSRRLDKISMTREELETGIDDPEIMTGILEALGYRCLFPVIKLRQLYHRDNITACVDQVEDLGSFMELEVLTDEEEYGGDLSRLTDILTGIGSSMEETTTSSYLSMLLKKHGKYQSDS